MHSSFHFYWYTNLFCLVWSPQQEERTIKWSRNIKQSAGWRARRLRSSLNGVGEEPFPLSSCWLRWSVREVNIPSAAVLSGRTFAALHHQTLFTVPHCLHRNYGLTAEEDKAAPPKRDGLLALLLWSFVSSFGAQQHSWRGWGELAGTVCSVHIHFLACSGCLLPRSSQHRVFTKLSAPPAVKNLLRGTCQYFFIGKWELGEDKLAVDTFSIQRGLKIIIFLGNNL